MGPEMIGRSMMRHFQCADDVDLQTYDEDTATFLTDILFFQLTIVQKCSRILI